jgi:ribosome-associated heat shock protein Hsp15
MPDGRQRIDRWLFFARFAKSRTLAARMVEGGKVRINARKADQASDAVKPGDALTLTLQNSILVVRVLDPGGRRGPPAEARLLYEVLAPPPGGAVTPPDAP